MKNKTTAIIGIGVLLILLQITPAMANLNEDTTTLEIINISGGFGGVTVEVKNTGEHVATKIAVTTTVQGGFLNKIDITHACTGCSDCGATLDAGAIKTEKTMEAGFMIGFGPIQITTSANAENAQEISDETTGFVIGPLVIIN
ncbi:hypothetical protein B6U98_05115 [Thermoplasmatales archaeon ex4572_165]|nr:MAG: hypothetical protein B6U98_05115 [Thermoplasmatales archaeon ex4572_165]